ncbi:hypothetical protein ACQKEN_04500 [Pseudomonas sp. NPDC078416]|uniref:hypothetical protein n=1 Tax=Pseudomonas sp. NPDC078416 TaxID=3390637 RepID=UPI003D05143A
MRGYMELIDFMKHLADGVLDYLPEDQRVGQLTVDQVIEEWMKGKSYFAARSLRNDLKSYIKLYKSGDYSVDEILSWYDLSFIPERFGCAEWELFTSILCSIDAHIERKQKDFLIKVFGWLGFR